jgi:proteasome lid subunit RPN8/RPN11
MIEENIKQKIKHHALAENPRECCGVVVSQQPQSLVFECRNVSDTPKKTFSLSPVDYLHASRKGKIKAIYHSHPNENKTFSNYDILNSQSHQLDYVLYNIPSDSFSFFDYKKNKTFIYNKPFKTQTADCYSLVKEYYQKLDINLLDEQNSRTNPDWHTQNPNLIEKIFKLNTSKNKHLFHQVNTNELKKHDILSFELVEGKGPIHVGVYLGDNTFTHHPRGKYPCIEPLNRTYKKRIHSIFRYEKFN